MNYLKSFILRLIDLYRTYLSPLHQMGCRYSPTCSLYTRQAIEKYGLLKGSWLGLKRILSCNRFSRRPHIDPLP